MCDWEVILRIILARNPPTGLYRSHNITDSAKISPKIALGLYNIQSIPIAGRIKGQIQKANIVEHTRFVFQMAHCLAGRSSVLFFFLFSQKSQTKVGGWVFCFIQRG